MADRKIREPSPPSSRWRRIRRACIVLIILVALFGLLGFFALPPIARNLAQSNLQKLLGRPVSVGQVHFNPYALSLKVDQVHVMEPGGATEFVGLDSLHVQVSWSSVWRLKPVVTAFDLEQPHLHIVRLAPQRFNFSDLIEKFAKPGPSSGKPLQFAVSNIRIGHGRIDFEDQVLKERHTVDQLDVGIPFVANLPSATDIYVQPAIDARVDGRLFSLHGRTKPFTATKQSEIALRLDAIDLPDLVGYSPTPLPVVIDKGQLSINVQVDFSMIASGPTVQVNGGTELDNLSVTDRAGHPLLTTKAIRVTGASLEPLRSIIRLQQIQIEDPTVFVKREKDGSINLASLAPKPPDGTKPPTESAAAGRSVATPAPSKSTEAATPSETHAPPLDFGLKSFALTGGHVHIDDDALREPQAFDLNDINVAVNDFSTVSSTPAHFDVKTSLAQGGALVTSGTASVADHKAQIQLQLSALAIPLAQPYLAGAFRGQLRKGQAGLQLSAAVDWSTPKPSIQLRDSHVSLDDLAVSTATGSAAVVALTHAQVDIDNVDLVKQEAVVSSVAFRGLTVNALRDAQGQINLLSLAPPAAKSPAPRAHRHPEKEKVAEPAWHYRVDSVDLSDSAINLTDNSQSTPVNLKLSKLHVAVHKVTDNLTLPLPVEASASLNSKGSFALRGNIRVTPIKAAIHLTAQNLDIASFEPYFGGKLNAVIASALLSSKADVSVAQSGKNWSAGFRGDVAVTNVRMLDKLTSDVFAGWRALTISQIRAAYGVQGTDVQLAKVDLESFYARIYLDNTGRLNLKNFLNEPENENKSLTRTTSGGAPASAPSVSVAKAAPATSSASASPAAPPMNLAFGEIDLHDGRVDYSDNFIKPNFSATLMNIQGQVGAFGTHSTQPAPVDLQANLEASGPVHITGSVNPLVTPPFLDMTANARDIELTNFSTYSTKYTGYPIVKGNLTVDVHYSLHDNQLAASNHFFIDQFTFGQHVDSPTATNLPIRLAISLLKDSKGQIDVNLPISGSLSDPHFSVGGILWHAFLNLIEKAVTAPFSLLTSSFGGSAPDVGYIEFDPGLSKVPPAQVSKVDTIAKALANRPAVKLDIIGRVDPSVDTPALKQVFVDRAVKAEKIRDVVGKGQSVDIDSITLTSDEYYKYLPKAYSHAKFNKPTNFIGIAKTLQYADMKKLMYDNANVSSNDLAMLARQRAIAVQADFNGKIPLDRVFIVAPKLDAAGINDSGRRTRVEFAVH